MATTFGKPGPALTEADLSPEGNRLGRTLPPAYRRWLLTTNGGTPKPRSFRTTDGESSGKLSVESFGWFPPAGGPVRDSVLDRHDHFAAELSMPRHLLPIASTVGQGGVLLMDLRGDEGGPVSHWTVQSPRFEYDERDGFVNVVALSVADLLAAFGFVP